MRLDLNVSGTVEPTEPGPLRRPFRLNLGCGRLPLDGWYNVDIRPGPGVNALADLDVEGSLGWVPDASADAARAFALLEHLPHYEHLVLEVARVLRPGAPFEIVVPYKNDHMPFHVRTFAPWSFNIFRSDHRPREMDLRRRTPEYDSYEAHEKQYFTQDSRSVEHYFPFAWHLARRFGRRVYRLPFGKRKLIYWVLRRNGLPYKREVQDPVVRRIHKDGKGAGLAAEVGL